MASADFDKLSKQIDNIYDAVLNPESWAQTFDGVASLSGGRGMMLFPLGQMTNAFTYVSVDIAEPVSSYFTEWLPFGRCPRAIAAQQRGLRRGVFWDGDLLDETTLNNHAFFNEYAPFTNLKYATTRLTTALNPVLPYVIATPRSVTAGVPVSEEMRVFEMLTAHLVRALQIYGKSTSGNSVGDGIATLLNHQDYGVVIVSPSGDVVFANDAVRNFEGDGLRIAGKRVVTAHASDQAAYDRLLASVLKPGPDLANSSPIALSRPSGKYPLLIQAMPFFRRDSAPLAALFRNDSGAIILISDPERVRPPASAHALKLLGLTEAEARLAAQLGLGHSPEMISATFELSISTVRNQLKSIFRKLDISRQSELVNFLNRIPIDR